MAVICIIKGARIVRMHDVAAAVAAVRMTEAVLGFRQPAYLRHNMEAVMNDAAISRVWPPRDAAALDDDQLAECYAIDDRSRQSVRVNFVASIDGAATDHGLSGGLSGPADKRVFDLLRRLSRCHSRRRGNRARRRLRRNAA